MINNINKFKGSNKQAVKKLNDIASAAGALRQLQGDGIINVKATPSGYAITLDVPRLFTLLPLYKRGGGSGSIDIRTAYCINNAGTGSTIDCYLDVDSSESETITVNCRLFEGASNLSDCAPRLMSHDAIDVFYDGNDWRCLYPFIYTEACDE
jgi:hypothetical protein